MLKTSQGKSLHICRSIISVVSAALPLTLIADESSSTIVVTANKVEQSLASTNANIEVVQGDELEDKGVKTVADLNRVFPELLVSTRGNSAYTGITLRGVSSPDFYSPNVLVYVDGVKQDMAFLDIPLANIARVELLKGPQGTLYGGNAYAGVINIVTKGAQDSGSLSLSTTQANLFQRYSLSATSRKLNSGFYAGVEGLFYKKDGQIDDTSTGKKNINGSDESYGQLTLGYAPDVSPLALTLSVSRDDLDSNEEIYVRDDELEDQTYESATLGPKGELDRTVNSYSFKAAYDTQAYKVMSITAYLDRAMDRYVGGQNYPEDQDTFSQEARVEFAIGKTSNLLGLYYEYESFTRNDQGFSGFSGPSENQVDRETFALFGQSRYQLNKVVDITAGARLDDSEVNIDFARTGTGAFSFDNKKTFTNFTPSVSVGWQAAPNNRVYATLSRGYKPGGFNHAIMSSADNAAYHSERSSNYELGWRTELPAHDLKMTAAMYLINAQNKQQYVGTVPNQVLTNLGDAQSYGVELNMDWLVSELLSVKASLNLGKSELKDSKDPFSDADYSGNTLPYSPSTQGSLALSYILPPDWFDFYVTCNASAHYNSRAYFDEANTLSQPSYTTYNTSVDLLFDNVKVSLFVDNLTDEVWRSYSYESGSGVLSTPGARRTIGLKASYSL